MPGVEVLSGILLGQVGFLCPHIRFALALAGAANQFVLGGIVAVYPADAHLQAFETVPDAQAYGLAVVADLEELGLQAVELGAQGLFFVQVGLQAVGTQVAEGQGGVDPLNDVAGACNSIGRQVRKP